LTLCETAVLGCNLGLFISNETAVLGCDLGLFISKTGLQIM